MFWSNLDSCVCYILISLLSDLFLRIFKIIIEFVKFNKNYYSNNKVLEISKRVFTYTRSTFCLLIVTIILFMWHLKNNSIYNSKLLEYLAFIPCRWLLYAVKYSSSSLDYAKWIRENHGLDYGAGMASNFYHGYLKFILPDDGGPGHLGISERIEQYEYQEKVEFITNRLVILLPNNLYMTGTIQSKILERARPLSKVVRNRAGVKREFSNAVYRFTKPIKTNKFLYVALEAATPLVSFWETMEFTPSATWQEKEMQREIVFKFRRHLKHLLNRPLTKDKVELVFYNANTEDVGEVLLAHFKIGVDHTN